MRIGGSEGDGGTHRPLDRQARGDVVLDDQARGVAAGRHAQPFARRIGVSLDRAFADLQQARDFLRLQVLGDQPQNLFLALGQAVDADKSIPQKPAPGAWSAIR